ncbi:hypothetical protein [Rhizobium sp. BK176]|uniref:hypothetical protein n=1 Tax=Rhizobium sp. BK176 TaxID=2587071 RepID=UPI0021684860|nr:hypothetical protein [Rhizobium sp. BK176]MCS4090188.1 hypothetical protein [Rhizobium sp. BK176]
MKQIAIALMISAVAASAAQAEVFDPEKFGIATFDDGLPKPPVKKPFYCEFSRQAAEGKSKVWSCNDGSTRYGEKNVWGEKPIEIEPLVLPPKVTEDPTIHMGKGVLLTLTTVSRPEECFRSGKYRYCERFKVPTFSYALTETKEQCAYLAPRLAARQYVVYRDLGVPVTVTYDCEGNDGGAVGVPHG